MTFEELTEHLSGRLQNLNGYEFKGIAPRIECADGTSLSVQASETHYSSPRNSYGPWYAVEVGYPSVAPPDSWAEYFDGDWESDRTASVYGYVPVELVIEFINEHGGVK